jgi:hypothetical protein
MEKVTVLPTIGRIFVVAMILGSHQVLCCLTLLVL